MAIASGTAPSRKRRLPRAAATRKQPAPSRHSGWGVILSVGALTLGALIVYALLEFHASYTVNGQSPIVMRLQWPLVIAKRNETFDAREAQLDQSRPLTAYQEYACRKFGSACRIALAIQRAENPQGKCETYHYNANGTLDWGYFQINTVHLQRPGVVLRNLLDCRANIDFAYILYTEHHGFSPWSTYTSGAYRKFLHAER